MSFRLVPISLNLANMCSNNRVDLWRHLGLRTSLLYFVVRVRCRRKES